MHSSEKLEEKGKIKADIISPESSAINIFNVCYVK